jgi:hypothetical protein
MRLFTRNKLEALFRRSVRGEDWLFGKIYGYDDIKRAI